MLVLSRREQEIITVGDDIRVRVLRIAGNRVRLGIEAPVGSRIIRGECAAGTKTETETASQGSIDHGDAR